MNNDELLYLANSRAYRVFGFGSETIDFAKRLAKLKNEKPAAFELLRDVADRIAFVDRLRFEVSREATEVDSNELDLNYVKNLDSLETYLLCTCIDALAGGRSPVDFPSWLENDPAMLDKLISRGIMLTSSTYLETTKRLYEAYSLASVGSIRRFVEFFVNLPEFVKTVLAESFTLIKGDFASEEFERRLDHWKNFSVDDKVRRIARDYLYSLRRSHYTHSGRRYEATQSAFFRMFGESGKRIPSDEQGWWSITSFQELTQGGSRTKYTLLARSSQDEGLLLRAIITTWVRLNVIGLPADERYFAGLMKLNVAVDTIQAFLFSMRRNETRLDLMLLPQTPFEHSALFYMRAGGFRTQVGKRLLQEFGEYVELLRQEIESYLSLLDKLNTRIDEFNEAYPLNNRDQDKQRRRAAANELAQEFSTLNLIQQIRSQHSWVYPNLKRHVESGQILYRFANAFSNEDSPSA